MYVTTILFAKMNLFASKNVIYTDTEDSFAQMMVIIEKSLIILKLYLTCFISHWANFVPVRRISTQSQNYKNNTAHYSILIWLGKKLKKKKKKL